MKPHIIILIAVFFMSACESTSFRDKTEDCTYSNCNSIEPMDCDLTVYFTRTSQTPNPRIFVILGDYEDYNVIDTILTNQRDAKDSKSITVSVNFTYTLVAEYFRGDDTIYAIDANYVYKKSRRECDSTCWKVENKIFNLKLKK